MPSRQSEGGSHRKPGVRADTCGAEELGTGHWSLELHRQVYRLERETALPRFPYSQVQEMINRPHSPSIPMEPRNAVLL